MKNGLSLKAIEAAIAKANPAQQKRLLRDLPLLLKISIADFGLLKVAEPSFDFWDNPEDAVYDDL